MLSAYGEVTQISVDFALQTRPDVCKANWRISNYLQRALQKDPLKISTTTKPKHTAFIVDPVLRPKVNVKVTFNKSSREPLKEIYFGNSIFTQNQPKCPGPHE